MITSRNYIKKSDITKINDDVNKIRNIAEKANLPELNLRLDDLIEDINKGLFFREDKYSALPKNLQTR